MKMQVSEQQHTVSDSILAVDRARGMQEGICESRRSLPIEVACRREHPTEKADLVVFPPASAGVPDIVWQLLSPCLRGVNFQRPTIG